MAEISNSFASAANKSKSDKSNASEKLAHLPLFLKHQQPEFEKIFDAVDAMPLDDTHCHLVTDRDAITTPKRFLERISLAGYAFPAYFPDGVYEQWLNSEEATKHELNKKYDIQSKVDAMTYDLSQSIFIKFLTKEMAQFLNCEPSLEAVIEARNAKGRENYWGYVNDLFRDVNLENIIHDTGYMEGVGKAEIDAFEKGIEPCRAHRIARIEAIQEELFGLDITFEEFEARYTTRLLDIMDGDGNFGKKSVGMKSYLLPDIGLIRPLYDRTLAANSWEDLRRSYSVRAKMDREASANVTKDLCRYTFTLTLEECLKRDLPMQIHTGDGEAPYVILRNQDPFFLEEVVRFDKDNMMRMPKIIPLHAGYPSVGKAAWLSHLYPNCYFELSIMTPFVHQSLYERYKQVLEAVPISKVLYASDNYHLPELFWISGRWGKRYLSQALADYVIGGSLTFDEATEAASMILHKNNRALYKLDP